MSAAEVPEVIILHETVLSSLLKDTGSLGTLAALAWFNHAYLGGSWPLDLFAVFCIFTFMLNRTAAAKRMALHMTIPELENWAMARKPPEQPS